MEECLKVEVLIKICYLWFVLLLENIRIKSMQKILENTKDYPHGWQEKKCQWKTLALKSIKYEQISFSGKMIRSIIYLCLIFFFLFLSWSKFLLALCKHFVGVFSDQLQFWSREKKWNLFIIIFIFFDTN